jgi:predicted MFS family arabinose efflux permease
MLLKENGLLDSDILIALSSFGAAALFSPMIVSHLADRKFSVNQILPVLITIFLFIFPFLFIASGIFSMFMVCFLFLVFCYNSALYGLA